MVLPDVPESLSASKPMAVTIAATNTGRAIWLFQTNFGPGAASLGWRWWQDDRPVPFGEGRAGLSHDIFPGGEERLGLEIWPPSAPGYYTLQLGMVRDPDMWFAEQWIRFQVDGRCDFEGVMDKAPPLQRMDSHRSFASTLQALPGPLAGRVAASGYAAWPLHAVRLFHQAQHDGNRGKGQLDVPSLASSSVRAGG